MILFHLVYILNSLAKELSRSVGILAQLKPYLNTKALLSLY